MAKSIVVYYSWASHAKEMAQALASQTGADLAELRPALPYSKDYGQVVRRAKEEILQGTRPDLLPPLPDLTPYDRVYVGAPIWCGTMAPPLASFLALQTWEGKRVFPFCTHGGGGKGRCEQDIRALSSGAQAEALGLCDYFNAGGICLIEWAQNIADVLPENCKKVVINKISDNAREIIYG